MFNWIKMLSQKTLPSVTPNAGSKRYVIAIMGQSNIDGRNSLSNLATFYPQFENPTSKVKIYNSTGQWQDWETGNPPEMFTTSAAYAADTQALQILSDRFSQTIYTAKKSRGGTGFLPISGGNGDWNINSTGTEDHFLPFIQRLDNTKTFIEQVENRQMVISALWMDIGETDAATNTKQEAKEMISDFVDYMLVYSGNTSLPIIWRELGIYQAGVTQDFIDLQNELAIEYPNIILIPNTDFTLKDAYHLDHHSTFNYANQVANALENIYNQL